MGFIGMMWLVVALFSLVHATELQDWTENSTLMGPESVAADASRLLVQAASVTGLVHLKSGIESIRNWVNDPVVLAKKPEPPAPPPPSKPPTPKPSPVTELAKVVAPIAAVTACNLTKFWRVKHFEDFSIPNNFFFYYWVKHAG